MSLKFLYRGSAARLPEWITLGVYAALVSFAIPYHEPWADEAQAWQLARSLSLHDLFQTHVRYEGTPGLWHFLLWLLVRLHVSYVGLHWICGAIALTAASILVLKSPFPRYLKLSLPFTYFLLFQYAIVARSYVLVPLLLFIIAACWKKSPVVMAVLLGLLGNVALHASMISGGLAIVYFAEQIQQNRDIAARHLCRKLFPGAAILAAFYAIAIWTAWPPHDLISRSHNLSHPFLEFAVISLAWGICQPWILAIPFWTVFALWLGARRKIIYLLPVLFFVVFSGIVYINFWHAGLVAPLVIGLLWITWPAHESSIVRYEWLGRSALILVTAVQIMWSAYALTYDRTHAYSPDLAASQFLKPFVSRGASIAVTYLGESDSYAYDAVGILPYFDRNIYVNLPEPFWWWRDKNPTDDLFFPALQSRPDIVLVETWSGHPQPIHPQGQKIELIESLGYRLTNTFCGTMPERLMPGLTMCHLVYRHS